jgi:hypothetical protein
MSPICESAQWAASQGKAAEMLSVGKRSVEYARIVRQHGDEALIAAVDMRG